MLGEILKKEDCAECRFCCAFRRVSQWETPIFTRDNYIRIDNKGPLYQDEEGYFRYSLKDSYRTRDESEEAACPYLDTRSGCILNSDQKPWDCKIWPLRVVRKQDESLWIVLTPTCPAINKLDLEAVRSYVVDALAADIGEYAKAHPGLIKEARDDFFIDLVEIR